jgi:hypothetical protein
MAVRKHLQATKQAEINNIVMRDTRACGDIGVNG